MALKPVVLIGFAALLGACSHNSATETAVYFAQCEFAHQQRIVLTSAVDEFDDGEVCVDARPSGIRRLADADGTQRDDDDSDDNTGDDGGPDDGDDPSGGFDDGDDGGAPPLS